MWSYIESNWLAIGALIIAALSLYKSWRNDLRDARNRDPDASVELTPKIGEPGWWQVDLTLRNRDSIPYGASTLAVLRPRDALLMIEEPDPPISRVFKTSEEGSTPIAQAKKPRVGHRAVPAAIAVGPAGLRYSGDGFRRSYGDEDVHHERFFLFVPMRASSSSVKIRMRLTVHSKSAAPRRKFIDIERVIMVEATSAATATTIAQSGSQ